MKTLLNRFLITLALLVGCERVNATSVFPIATNASLVQLSGGIAASGSNYVVSILSGSNVCVQLVSTNGNLLGSLIAIGTSKGFPRIAFGGTNYLVIWEDDYAINQNLYGQIVSRSGVPVGSSFSMALNTAASAVASDGTNYLVVSRDGIKNFYGQLVTGGGTLSGSAFLISSQQQNGKYASATFGTTNYLVIWQSNNGSIGNTNKTYGAFVFPNGLVTSFFQIGQTAAPDQNFLGLAFDGTNYLAVWQWNSYPEATNSSGSVTNWNIFGRLVSQTGNLPGNELQLVTDAGNNQVPSLAFDGSNYLLTWSYGFQVITNTNIRFQFLNRSGNAVGSRFTLFTAQGTNTPLFAFNGLIYDGTRYAIAANLGTSISASGVIYGGFIPRLPTLTASNYVGTQFSLRLTGTPGFNYAILMSTNLALTNWTAIATNSPTNGTFTFTDTSATNKSRFYRALSQ